jgi:predicted metal-binding membrane protein
VLLAAIAGAWILAIVAELSGRTNLFHHHHLVGGGLAVWAALGLFLVSWQAHVTAMMLPSSLPLIRLFNHASSSQARPAVVRAAFLAGYGAVWTAFGLLAFAGDAVVHRVEHNSAWLHERPHLIAGATLLLAGAFQFSELKDRCLRQCRHPALFLQRHYRRGVGEAFALGRSHGVFCLGCCWALMLVMFAVGIANLAWMAPLALIMLYEKTGVHGERAVTPIGAALLLLGVLVMAMPGRVSEFLTMNLG